MFSEAEIHNYNADDKVRYQKKFGKKKHNLTEPIWLVNVNKLSIVQSRYCHLLTFEFTGDENAIVKTWELNALDNCFKIFEMNFSLVSTKTHFQLLRVILIFCLPKDQASGFPYLSLASKWLYSELSIPCPYKDPRPVNRFVYFLSTHPKKKNSAS